MYKLEIAFIQGTSFVSKLISKISHKFVEKQYKGDFNPSHVFLVLNDSIIFESSTYKTAGQDDEKVMEKGTRVLLTEDRADEIEDTIIKRTILAENIDPYIALKYVAKASNYKYSYNSIFKFLFNGRFKKEKSSKQKNEYICSGLVLDAMREDYFKNNSSVQKVINKFKNIDSNSVTPLDLYLALCEAGFMFRTCKGLNNAVRHL